MSLGRELLTGGNFNFDVAGPATANRIFRYDTQNIDAALTDSITPALYSTHPDFPAMYCTALIPRSNEDGTYDITATYSTRPWADSPPPTKAEGDAFVRWTNGTTKKKLHIPGAVKTPVRVPLPDNTSKVIYPWLPYDFDVPRTYGTITLETTVKKLAFGDVAAIAAKSDKVHTIFGKKYLFSLEFGTPINDKYDVLRYQWVYDPGSPAFPVPTADVVLPYLDRLPFTRWVRVPQPNAETQPKYLTVPEYDEEPNGYQGLPGVTL